MKVSAIIEEHRDMTGSVVPVLQEINNTFNHLSEPALRFVSENLNIPLSEVLRIATFYSDFGLEPRGRYTIAVCLGTTCHLKGADDIVSAFEDELGIKTGEMTEDGLFTLDAVRCIGCCALAPVLKVNEDVYGFMTRQRVPELIEKYRGL